MQSDEFMQQVQDVARVGPEGAERVTRATLATLGEYLYRTEQADFGAQLPPDLRALMNTRAGPEQNRQSTDRMELQDFYNRVSARADLGFQQAVRQSRAVMTVLRAAVSEGAWESLRAQFPSQYDDLLMPADLDRQTIPTSPRSSQGR